MNHKSIGIGICAKWIMGALTLAIASMSYASSNTLVGGGPTLPVIGYAGNSSNSLVYPAGAGSLFGVFSAQSGNPSVSYCETTEGIALAVFYGATIGTGSGYSVQGTCPSQGFGAKTVGNTVITQPSYIVLNWPLTASEYTDYADNHSSGGYPVQFPALAASIAIAFNLTDSLGNPVTSSEANFTDSQLCEIFSGAITNWNQVASAFTLTDGGSIPSESISVQYRSDGNGTTASLANHLAAACGAINSTFFETSFAFTSVIANFFPSGIPSNWTGSNGNAVLATAIAGTANSIGYVETADTLATNPGLQFADVNGLSPTTNFGSPLTLTATTFVYNEVISSTNNANGTAAIEAISSLPDITNPPTTSCIALVKPADYALPGVRGGLVPSGTYPIVDITYLLANSKGNGTALAATQGLLEAPYNSTITGSVTTVGAGTGLALLTLGANAFTTAQIGSCLVD
jgi:phosphate transport system substrate-binding protein